MPITTETIQIGLVGVGDIIAIPTGKIKNNDIATAVGVKVIVDIPAELQYSSSLLPVGYGNYNVGTNTWENITLLAGDEIEGIIYLEILDDTDAVFTITFTVTADGACENCQEDNIRCVITSGIGCSEVMACVPLVDDVPADYSSRVLGINCDGEITTVNPITKKAITEYRSQAADIAVTLAGPTILHIEPTEDLTVTITKGDACDSDEIIIKHLGIDANANWKIRVINASGLATVDEDTYFEFDNTTFITSNNSRGSNMSTHTFYYFGNELYVI